MNSNDFAEQRGELVQSIEREQEELREAVHELSDVARSKLTVSEHIKAAPHTWLVGGFLLGLWLGGSRSANRTGE